MDEDPVNLNSGSSLYMNPIAENYVTVATKNSYWLSRDLINTERLDWSTCADNTNCSDAEGDIKGECTKFLLRTSPDSNGNALLEHICYPLIPGASVSPLS